MLEGERLLTAMSYTILKIHKSKRPRGSNNDNNNSRTDPERCT